MKKTDASPVVASPDPRGVLVLDPGWFAFCEEGHDWSFPFRIIRLRASVTSRTIISVPNPTGHVVENISVVIVVVKSGRCLAVSFHESTDSTIVDSKAGRIEVFQQQAHNPDVGRGQCYNGK